MCLESLYALLDRAKIAQIQDLPHTTIYKMQSHEVTLYDFITNQDMLNDDSSIQTIQCYFKTQMLLRNSDSTFDQL